MCVIKVTAHWLLCVYIYLRSCASFIMNSFSKLLPFVVQKAVINKS